MVELKPDLLERLLQNLQTRVALNPKIPWKPSAGLRAKPAKTTSNPRLQSSQARAITQWKPALNNYNLRFRVALRLGHDQNRDKEHSITGHGAGARDF